MGSRRSERAPRRRGSGADQTGGSAPRAGRRPRPLSTADSDDPAETGRRDGADRQLPESLRPLFWDCDFDRLRLDESAEFVIGRVLVSGSWPHIAWLRKTVGDAALRQWILNREGRILSRKQLRFWELVLKLPAAKVDQWLADKSRAIWDGRVRA